MRRLVPVFPLKHFMLALRIAEKNPLFAHFCDSAVHQPSEDSGLNQLDDAYYALFVKLEPQKNK